MAKETTIDLSQGPNPLPKEGDTIAFVQEGNRIVQGKVASVDAKSDGRAITIEGVTAPNKKPLRVVHRPKAALAGNTWHWPVALLVLLACMAIALAVPAFAALPTYRSFSGYGSATQPATVILPADPNSQIRVVTVYYSSDTNIAQFTFTSGGTAWSVAQTNLTGLATNSVGSTNGMYGGEQVMLQHNGSGYTNSIATFGYATNINSVTGNNGYYYINTTTAFGVAPTIGDNIWQMTNSASINVAITTNALNGDDIYSGNYGAPVEVQLGPCQTTNRLSTVSAHYDNAAQF
jgi:hypothetical protein